MAATLWASLGATVSGLDASDTLLEIARERAPSADFRLGDLEALPFDDDSFDVVTGFNSFQYAAADGSDADRAHILLAKTPTGVAWPHSPTMTRVE